jgi:hypothetical protein
VQIPFGLERLPRTTDPNDPRLPAVAVSAGKLRLNSAPLPQDAVMLASTDHATRIETVTRWMGGLCGDYNPNRQRFIAAYFRSITAHLNAYGDELIERLRRYDGLFQPHDWLWSALRPLPRAWLPADAKLLPCDFAFWDGERPIAVELAAQETERTRALGAAGLEVRCVAPGMLDGDILGALPDGFRWFWRSEVLPSSPFGRPVPDLPAHDAFAAG